MEYDHAVSGEAEDPVKANSWNQPACSVCLPSKLMTSTISSDGPRLEMYSWVSPAHLNLKLIYHTSLSLLMNNVLFQLLEQYQ